MRAMAEVWRVTLLVDGLTVTEDVTIEPPICIAPADAEVKAIKSFLGAAKVRALSSRFIREVPAAGEARPIDAMTASYFVGYEQGRLGAAARSEAAPGQSAPRDGFSRDAWRALTDAEKVDALLKRIGAGPVLVEVGSAFARMSEVDRRGVVESIGSVFCMGCGDIQGIDEHGHLDGCQCQNDE